MTPMLLVVTMRCLVLPLRLRELALHLAKIGRRAVASWAIRSPRGPTHAARRRLGSGSGGGVNVDLKVRSHPATYRKLFHLLIGNCLITCRLLIEITVGRAPKFVSTKYF